MEYEQLIKMLEQADADQVILDGEDFYTISCIQSLDIRENADGQPYSWVMHPGGITKVYIKDHSHAHLDLTKK